MSDHRTSLLHGEITERVIGCAINVHNELGPGFLEAVYERALAVAMEDAGLEFELQKPLAVRYLDRIVGIYYADVIVAEKVRLELKAARTICPEHEAQLIHYMKATGIAVGVLLNFGGRRLEIKRLVRHADEPPEISMG